MLFSSTDSRIVCFSAPSGSSVFPVPSAPAVRPVTPLRIRRFPSAPFSRRARRAPGRSSRLCFLYVCSDAVSSLARVRLAVSSFSRFFPDPSCRFWFSFCSVIRTLFPENLRIFLHFTKKRGTIQTDRRFPSFPAGISCKKIPRQRCDFIIHRNFDEVNIFSYFFRKMCRTLSTAPRSCLRPRILFILPVPRSTGIHRSVYE